MLHIFGINYKSAPVEIREKLIFDDHQQLFELKQQAQLSEVLTLATCNRSELITVTNNVESIQNWLTTRKAANWQDYTYQYQDREAIIHILRVACGLDSMVLGEPQILGQMKGAFAAAADDGSVGHYLGHLFPFVFSVAKKVRSVTGISANSVSIAYTAVTLAKSIFTDLKTASVLLVGAGEMINLVAQYLIDVPVSHIIIANRTLEKSQNLAENVGGRAITIGDIPTVLAEVDMVISSTASQLPILGKGLFERVLKIRKHRPMFIVDLAVPRDIEAEVAELDDIYLYNIDDLQKVVQENLQNRVLAAEQAQMLIESELEGFLHWQNSLESVPAICAYRQKMQQFRDDEVAKAKKRLQQGQNAEQIVERLAQDLTQKLMHGPSVEMRKASSEGNFKFLHWAKQLFQL